METRQAKRRRLTQLALTTHTTPQTPLYFNTLPRDAIMEIIRQMSKRPHVSYWQSYVDSAEAQSILRCGGVLTDSARAMFTDLTYGLYKPRKRFGGQTTSLLVSKDTDFNQLLLELGPQLRSLSFTTGPDNYDITNCLYLENCHQLRELTIKDWSQERATHSLERILKSCGNSLTHLSMFGNRHLKSAFVKSVIRHCTVLESLSFNHRTVSVKMDQFWKVIGRTLKCLKCFSPIPPHPTAEALEIVRLHCTQLQDVEILGNPRLFPIIEFYKNMGSRLRVLRFYSNCNLPKPEIMQEILDECPNVMVDILIVKRSEQMLRVLGARVRKLGLRCITNPSLEFPNIADALTGLTELRVLGLRLNSLKFVEALFDTPKCNLIKLSIDRVHVFEHHAGALLRSISVLEAVAASVRSLREFECFSNNPLEVASFERLLQSNKDLQRFAVTFNYDGGTVTNADLEANSVRLVRSLAQFRSVTEFEVYLPGRKIVSNDVRNACVPLRGRQLNLMVGHVQYLPTFHSPF